MAREKREEARAMLAESVDPLADNQEKVLLASIAAATTLRLVADTIKKSALVELFSL